MKSNFLLSFLLSVLLSCHKDADIITVVDKPDPPTVLVTTKLVTMNDTSTAASYLASQSFLGITATYGEFPYIISDGHMINRDFELVRLESKDHLEFYRVENLIENDINYLHWKRPDISFALASSSDDVKVTLSPEISLEIPANSILRSDGSVFNGSYKIAYSILNPTSSAFEAIPSCTGIKDHQHVSLQFYHCIYVDVLSESDEKLKFSPTAFLALPPTSNQDLWQFSAESSAWVNIGTQQSESRLFLGESLYYGVAIADPAIRVTGSFDLNGKRAPHYELQILYGNTTQKIYTTNSGTWAAMVPSGMHCTIEATLPCSTKYTHSFETKESSFDLPLSINQSTCVNAVYSGVLRDNKASALNGIIELSEPEPNFYYTDHPEFSFNVPTCLGQKRGIRGIDVATEEAGPVIYWEAADSIKMFSVFACEEANHEYLSLQVSNDSKMYWDLKTGIQQSRLIIEEGSAVGELDLMVLISGMQEGEYQNTELNILFEDRQLGAQGYSLYCPTSPNGCGFSKFIITHFPTEQGQWIRGYFEGLFWIKTFHPLTAGYRPVRGEFQVFRDF